MVEILPSAVSGVVRAPASKSLSQRAILLAALTGGESRIASVSDCDDTRAAVRAARVLGARVAQDGTTLRVTAGAADGSALGGEINCGESGFCMRALSALTALSSKPFLLQAEGSLRSRPAGEIEAPLKALGASCETRSGHPPIRVCGPLSGGVAEVDGSQSSQFLSGLLMALPKAPGESRLTVRNLQSKPYVEMTLEMIRRFGGEIDASPDLLEFRILGGQAYRRCDYEVEGDWSGAAFWLVAGAVAGEIEIEGFRADSLQADRAVVDALELAGASIRWDAERLCLSGGALRGFSFDATHCPDLFPALAVLACACAGESRIAGVGRLKHKESDRATALVEELGGLGGRLRVEGDSLCIEGMALRGGSAHSRGDHRMAMALAIAGLLSREGVRIEGEACVAKSYPGFFEDLARLRTGDCRP